MQAKASSPSEPLCEWYVPGAERSFKRAGKDPSATGSATLALKRSIAHTDTRVRTHRADSRKRPNQILARLNTANQDWVDNAPLSPCSCWTDEVPIEIRHTNASR